MLEPTLSARTFGFHFAPARILVRAVFEEILRPRSCSCSFISLMSAMRRNATANQILCLEKSRNTEQLSHFDLGLACTTVGGLLTRFAR